MVDKIIIVEQLSRLPRFARGVGPFIGPSHPSLRDNDNPGSSSLRGDNRRSNLLTKHNFWIEQAKRSIFFVIYFIGINLHLQAQTTVPGGTINGATWNSAGSPYQVTGNLQIINLTIEADVQILFEGDYNFEITGVLAAQGTYNDSITFKAAPANSNGWNGLFYNGSAAANELRYCRIQDVSAQAGVNAVGSTLLLRNCDIIYNENNGLRVKDAYVTAFNCRFNDNGDNGVLADAWKTVLFNCIVARNQQQGLFVFSGNDSVAIVNSVVADNGGTGIFSNNGDVIISNSIIYNNETQISYSGTAPLVTYCDIEGGFAGNGNIIAAPDFVETDFYAISGSSLCVDHGDPAADFNDHYFPPSQGMGRNDMGAHGGPAAGRWYKPLYVRPLSIAFNQVRRDSTKSDRVSVKNYTDTMITVSGITLTGPDADNFAPDTSSFALAVYDSLPVAISFTPDRSGSFTANMQILSDQGDENVSLTGSGVVPNIYVSEDQLNFGEVTLGDSMTLSFSATNTGTDTLKVQEMATRTAFYSISPTSLTIPPFQSPQTINVLFKPDTGQFYQDTVTIHSNDPDPGDNPTYIALTGTGRGPLIAVSTDSVQFKQVRIPRDSTISFILQNRGNADLIIDTILVTGLYASSFKISDQTFPLVITPAAGSLDIPVVYTPDNRAHHEAIVKIAHNDRLADTTAIALSGQGIAPELTVGIASLDLGKVAVDSSKTALCHIQNTGEVVLTISELEFRKGDSTSFKWESDLLADPIIGSGSSAVINITVTPRDTGDIWSQLSIISDDPITPKQSITVSAKGTAPEIWFESSTCDFGRIALKTDSTRNIRIKNKGNATLFIAKDSVAIATNNAFSCSLAGDVVLPPDSVSDAITVRFAPKDTLPHAADLIIRSNDWPDNPSIIKLTGNGYDPAKPIIQVTPRDTLNFSKVVLTTTEDSSVVVTNKGDKNLSISDVRLQNKDDDSLFSIEVSDLPVLLTQNGTMSITITFDSHMSLGIKNNQLIIESNDASGNSHYILHLVAESVRDESPASIRIDFSSINLVAGSADTLKFIINDDNTKIDSAAVYLRRGGQRNIISLPQKMNTARDTVWYAFISAEQITARGIEYVVEAFHGGAITTLPEKGMQAPAALTVAIPYMAFPDVTLKNDYQMISIPFDTRGKSMSDLFGDDLGSYDNKRFRLFDWQQQDEKYIELTDMEETLPPGKALWLITKEPTELDVTDGVSLPTDTTFAIPLQQGWNMIADPFYFPVDWQMIDSTNKLYYYNGNGWEMVQQLESFKGYAVYAEQSTILTIPPVEAHTIQKTAGRSLFPEALWYLQISAEKGVYHDRDNYIGVYKSGATVYPYYHTPEPPSIGNSVSLYAVHPDRPGKRFITDFRAMDQEHGHQFSVQVSSNFKGKTGITVTPVNLPDDFDWAVVAPELKIKYAKGAIYTDLNDHRLDVFIGTKDYLSDNLQAYNDLPRTFNLAQNFPNPFNPATRIKYQVPKVTNVTLEIYDLLGRRIVVLAKNELREPGYYQIEWNGTNQYGIQVASGLYVLTLRADSYFKAVKMILQK